MQPELILTPLLQTSAALRREMGRLATRRICRRKGPAEPVDARDTCPPLMRGAAWRIVPSRGRRPVVTLYCLEADPIRSDAPLDAIAQRFDGLDLRVMWLSHAACDELMSRCAEFRGLIVRAASAHLATLTLRMKGPLQ